MTIAIEGLKAKYFGEGKLFGRAEFDKWFADYDVQDSCLQSIFPQGSSQLTVYWPLFPRSFLTCQPSSRRSSLRHIPKPNSSSRTESLAHGAVLSTTSLCLSSRAKTDSRYGPCGISIPLQGSSSNSQISSAACFGRILVPMRDQRLTTPSCRRISNSKSTEAIQVLPQPW